MAVSLSVVVSIQLSLFSYQFSVISFQSRRSGAENVALRRQTGFYRPAMIAPHSEEFRVND